MATKTFKIGLSNTDKQNMAQAIYERLLALTFPEYDTTTEYDVGDFVVYNDQLYKCIGATSGAWDNTKWQLATLNDLLTDIEDAVAFVNDKANVDGNYPTLTAGNADQLNSTVYVADKVPYLYRTSGGDADIGNREYDKIIGGSLAVNQLVQNGNFASNAGWTANNLTLSVSNNIATITNQDNAGSSLSRTDLRLVNLHKYFIRFYAKPTISTKMSVYFYDGTNFYRPIINATQTANVINKNEIIYSYTGNSANSGYLFLYVDDNAGIVDGQSEEISNIVIFDLTAIFGSTIADYIYSLEQANAGAGVAWFKNYFKEEYYPFNVGAIKNVKLISHDMVGFNQWDEEWEVGGLATDGSLSPTTNQIRSKNFIKVIPNTTYYGYVGGGDVFAIHYYYKDQSGVELGFVTLTGSGTFTIPNDVYWIKFNVASSYGTTYKHDICINLSWSGWRNGQYEKYQKNSYPLDTTIELRGIPKLDSNNNLYFDGDEYSSDGKVVRKYGSYTFTGSETFAVQSEEYLVYRMTLSGMKVSSHIYDVGVLMTLYTQNREQPIGSTQPDQTITVYDGKIYIRDTSCATSSALLTKLTGKTIYFELETPTEETATPFQEPQIVDDFGTEEYVVPTQDGWQVPVGHDTKYPANLRDKLQRLPDMPSVSQNVTETYVVNYNGATKKCTFVDIAGWLGANGWIKLTDITGYDSTKTQSLKNVNGTLTWVTEGE